MGVPTEAHRHRRESTVEGGEVQEYERLDQLAQIGGTHQSRDRPLGVSARAIDDFTDGILNLTRQHYLFLQRLWLCGLFRRSAELLEQLNENRPLAPREPPRRP